MQGAPAAGRRRGRLPRLRKRAEFKAAACGRRFHTSRMSVQALLRGAQPRGGIIPAGPRFGLTVTKKTGGAVERNRIRRRLRAALGALAPRWPQADIDFVVVARRDALTAPFPALVEDLDRALATLTEKTTSTTFGAKRARAQSALAAAPFPGTETDRP
ncbi:ribonuclease P protein component [Chelatococcus daeguensis]|uniref:Ribonuclease P protein component n=1 Tax=Chelatococcus daeguensis TaxID=444444 RepID=A0AAC9JM53_9HYPH|nr:ribonuclease P protein component [Chelatococcus daeguensis]APF36147.1 ribonuclease P protein component [Chelatococcus daeguensis]KZE35006.1 hypothetical protein AVW15_15165 [Chelatococcus daeguensis]MBM3083001.1 ribonuclease P protein component [Chelatococcus daeguensis]